MENDTCSVAGQLYVGFEMSTAMLDRFVERAGGVLWAVRSHATMRDQNKLYRHVAATWMIAVAR